MPALPLCLIDPRTSSQPSPNHQLKLRPRRQLLQRNRRSPRRSRSHQQPNHRLRSRPSRQFESLAILHLPKLSRRLTLLLPRRETTHAVFICARFVNASTRKSPQSKPTRPRSPTRPIKVSSHLTAPTAASAARQDSQPSKASVSVSKPAVANRPQARAPAATTKPAARSSLASTASVPKKTESKPASAPKGPDDSFLARMMRPTASSASKVHDKTEVKSPPKRTPSVIRPKAPTKPKTAKVEKPKSSSSLGEKAEQAAGASTPQAVSDDQEHGNAELEATPAFDTATIR